MPVLANFLLSEEKGPLITDPSQRSARGCARLTNRKATPRTWLLPGENRMTDREILA